MKCPVCDKEISTKELKEHAKLHNVTEEALRYIIIEEWSS